MNRFYRMATGVLLETEAMIDKFVGDEVGPSTSGVWWGPDTRAQPFAPAGSCCGRGSSEGGV